MSEENIQQEISEETGGKEWNNSTAKGLHYLGVAIIVVGLIGGLVMLSFASNTYQDELKTVFQIRAIMTAVAGVVSGSLFIGIGEIVSQLTRIGGR